MERIERTDAPAWLKKKWRGWGEEWESGYAKTRNSRSFKWRRYEKKGYDDLLLELSAMTQHHCSFCDAYPLGSRLKPTIEHFRPKTKFPLEAYKWENLFLCCCRCQEKGDAFDERLLKPDEDDYSFDKYFDIDWTTGRLKSNRDASEEDQERARITIEYYRLNHNGKHIDRKRELRHFQQMNNPDIDEFAYRFFIRRK